MTRAEAEKMGAVPVKTRAQAEAEGATPAPNQTPDEPSTLDRIGDYLKSKEDTALRLNPATGPVYSTVQAFRHPEEIAPRMRSLLSGATLGFAPKILSKLEGSDPEVNRALYAKAVEDYPSENAAGSFAIPMFGAGVEGLSGAAARIASGSAQQGINRYNLAAPGHEKQDMGEGLVSGALGSGVIEGIAASAKPLYDAAGKSFLRAIGPRAGIENFLDREGIAAGKASGLGHELQNEGLVPPLGGKEKANALAVARMKELGPQYESLDKRFDEAVTNSRPPPTGTVGARPANIAPPSTFNFRAASAAATPRNLDPEEKAVAGPANRFAARLAEGQGGLNDARQQMTNAARGADFRFKPPLPAELHRDALGRARENYSSQIGEVLGPEEQQAAKQLDRRYALAKTAENFSRPAAQREVLHQPVNPTHMLLGGEIGGVKGAALAGLSNVAMSRVNAPLGHLERSLSRAGQSVDSPHLRGVLGISEPGMRAGGRSFADWLSREDAKDRLKNDR